MHPDMSSVFESIPNTMLECPTAAVEAISPGKWHVRFPAVGMTLRVQAQPDWLSLETLADDAWRAAVQKQGTSPEHLLRGNALLTGNIRFAPGGNGIPILRAGLPLLRGLAPAPRVSEAYRAFCDAARALFAGWPAIDGPALTWTASAGSATADLKARCAESGWAITERHDGVLAVELEARGSVFAAHLEAREDGSAQATVRVAMADDLAPGTLTAMTEFLWRSGSVLRFVRPALREREGRREAIFQVSFDTEPAGAEMACALEALTVACHHCGREISMLFHAQTAAEFVKLGNSEFIPPPLNQPNTKGTPS